MRLTQDGRCEVMSHQCDYSLLDITNVYCWVCVASKENILGNCNLFTFRSLGGYLCSRGTFNWQFAEENGLANNGLMNETLITLDSISWE